MNYPLQERLFHSEVKERFNSSSDKVSIKQPLKSCYNLQILLMCLLLW